jgi:hypothetical protein
MRYLNIGTVTQAAILLMCLGQACNRNSSMQTDANQGGSKEQTFADASSAATQSLTAFRQLVNKENATELD